MFFKKKTEEEKKYATEWKLHKSLFGGSLVDMNRALQQGADINWKNKDGMTALYYCCSKAGDYGFNDILDRKLSNHFGLAVINLLALGADPNFICSAKNETAMHVFVTRMDAFSYQSNAIQIANAFTNSGFDISIKNKNNQTAADILQKLGKSPDRYGIGSGLVKKSNEETKKHNIDQDSSELWQVLGGDEIARIQVQHKIGYKITEIFNFSAKNYKSITQNLETKVETQVMKTFAELNDPALLNQAQAKLDEANGVRRLKITMNNTQDNPNATV